MCWSMCDFCLMVVGAFEWGGGTHRMGTLDDLLLSATLPLLP